MNELLAVIDHPAKAVAMRHQLGKALDLAFCTPYGLQDQSRVANVIFDIDLCEEGAFRASKDWIDQGGCRGHVIVSVDGPRDHWRASVLGASEIASRPLKRKDILDFLLGDFDQFLLDAQGSPIRSDPCARAAIDALSEIFSAARFGSRVDRSRVTASSDVLGESIARDGLANWLNIVRKHHSQTYQHSLIVAGLVAAYCGRLGFNVDDLRLMTEGAFLHDLGKLYISMDILEKPAALDEAEWRTMKTHPELGYRSLADAGEFGRQTGEMILHHHELLDGTGYPHGLSSRQLSDHVRILTLCDILGALIEKRSYKPSMSCDQAIAIMRNMGSKLDQSLLRELSFCRGLPLAA